MNKQEFEQLIDNGIEKNIVVHDMVAKSGEYTRYLELLINKVFLEVYGRNVDYIIIPVDRQSINTTNYFKTKQCSFPSDKERLVIGVSKEDVILGAY